VYFACFETVLKFFRMHSYEQNAHLRWRILGLSCAILFGLYYCFDIPAMVHDRLGDYSGLKKNDTPWFFNSLYSAYSLPNLVLPLFSGWILDKSSGSKAVLILAVIACIGQGIVVAGITTGVAWVSICGRVVFGIGAESMGVAQNAILTHFFPPREIALALTINVSMARIGTIMNDWITPHVEIYLGIPAAFSVGLLLCAMSLICTGEIVRVMNRPSCSESSNYPSRESVSDSSILASTKSLGATYWIVAVTCVAGYCAITPFTSVFTAVRPAGLSQADAGRIVSIAFLICALITPVIGKFVDNPQRANSVLLTSSLLLCLTHAMFESYNHFLVMSVLGLGFAGLVASVWPLVPFSVSEHHVGLAYGIMTALQNLGLTVMPLLVRFHSHSKS
jgi:MFS family permease